MDFYTSIAEYYDYIFPFDVKQLEFVSTHMDNLHKDRLLDVGCGVGLLTAELSKLFDFAIGLDIDSAMLQKAISTYKRFNLSFKNIDMLEIGREFEENSFSAILSFGNTLVHLKNLNDINLFLKKCYSLLCDDGKIFLQTINYDRILNNNLPGLPTIENDFIKFVRKYNYKEDLKLIEFTTELTVKQLDKKIINCVQLYPLLYSEILNALTNAGFKNIEFYGNFASKEFDFKESIPLIVTADK